MAITNTILAMANVGGYQRPVMAFTTAAYTTVNAYADVAGSDLDALLLDTLGITIQNAGNANGITYQVVAANLPDFSDAVIATNPAGTAGAGNIAFGAIGSFSTYFLPFRYYKVQAKAQTAGNQSTVVVNTLGTPA